MGFSENVFCHESCRHWSDLDDTSAFESFSFGPHFGKVSVPGGAPRPPQSQNLKALNPFLLYPHLSPPELCSCGVFSPNFEARRQHNICAPSLILDPACNARKRPRHGAGPWLRQLLRGGSDSGHPGASQRSLGSYFKIRAAWRRIPVNSPGSDLAARAEVCMMMKYRQNVLTHARRQSS